MSLTLLNSTAIGPECTVHFIVDGTFVLGDCRLVFGSVCVAQSTTFITLILNFL